MERSKVLAYTIELVTHGGKPCDQLLQLLIEPKYPEPTTGCSSGRGAVVIVHWLGHPSRIFTRSGASASANTFASELYDSSIRYFMITSVPSSLQPLQNFSILRDHRYLGCAKKNRCCAPPRRKVCVVSHRFSNHSCLGSRSGKYVSFASMVTMRAFRIVITTWSLHFSLRPQSIDADSNPLSTRPAAFLRGTVSLAE